MLEELPEHAAAADAGRDLVATQDAASPIQEVELVVLADARDRVLGDAVLGEHPEELDDILNQRMLRTKRGRVEVEFHECGRVCHELLRCACGLVS